MTGTDHESKGRLGAEELSGERHSADQNEREPSINPRPFSPFLEKISQASQQLQKMMTPEALAAEIVHIFDEYLGHKEVAVVIVEEESGRLVPFAASRQRLGRELPVGQNHFREGAPGRHGAGLITWVVEHGESVRLGDVRKDPRYYAIREGVRSKLCVPLWVKGRVIGAVDVESDELNKYNAHDQHIVELFAGQLALSIENTRINSWLRRYALEHEKGAAHLVAELEANLQQLEKELEEKRRIQSRLRMSEIKYRNLIESLPAVAYIAERTVSRRTVYISPQIESLLGYTAIEWEAKPDLWYLSLHPDDRDKVLSTIAKSWANERSSFSLEYRLISRDGRIRWIRDEARVIRTESSGRLLVHGIMVDISRHKLSDEDARKHSQELADLNAELIAQNAELNAFSHTVAHDLKNPLAILMGFAEMLMSDYGDTKDPVLRQGISVIMENGQRMESIIDELLLLAEVRQLDQVAVEPLDMSGIIHEIDHRLSNMIADSGAKITAMDEWPVALGHRPWVYEIWVNYVSNAIKYGGRPPTVQLGATVQRDGMVRFWVKDNGPGISREDQKRLFAPFTKLEYVRAEGHGLGLSIVQRIVTKLNGEVGVDSEPGRGSIFWFTLPRAEERTSP